MNGAWLVVLYCVASGQPHCTRLDVPLNVPVAACWAGAQQVLAGSLPPDARVVWWRCEDGQPA